MVPRTLSSTFAGWAQGPWTQPKVVEGKQVKLKCSSFFSRPPSPSVTIGPKSNSGLHQARTWSMTYQVHESYPRRRRMQRKRKCKKPEPMFGSGFLRFLPLHSWWLLSAACGQTSSSKNMVNDISGPRKLPSTAKNAEEESARSRNQCLVPASCAFFLCGGCSVPRVDRLHQARTWSMTYQVHESYPRRRRMQRKKVQEPGTNVWFRLLALSSSAVVAQCRVWTDFIKQEPGQ